MDRLRVPEDVHMPCVFCNRKFLKADAHWFCARCRNTDPGAECPEDCEACIAMKEIDWRKKALEASIYRKQVYKKSNSKAKSYKKKASKSKVKTTRTKMESVTKKKLPTAGPSKIKSKKVESTKLQDATPYTNRLLSFEAYLYKELKPVIPSSLTEKGFTLPEIPEHLKRKYDVTRCELVRLLASSSVCYHLSKNRSQFCDENNQIFNASSDGIVSLFASLIKFKANTLGKIIFEIRKDLLSGVTCANPKIIMQMIKGPINPKESFFGNINLLEEAVSHDKKNKLKMFEGNSTKKHSNSKEDYVEVSDSEGSDMY